MSNLRNKIANAYDSMLRYASNMLNISNYNSLKIAAVAGITALSLNLARGDDTPRPQGSVDNRIPVSARTETPPANPSVTVDPSPAGSPPDPNPQPGAQPAHTNPIAPTPGRSRGAPARIYLSTTLPDFALYFSSPVENSFGARLGASIGVGKLEGAVYEAIVSGRANNYFANVVGIFRKESRDNRSDVENTILLTAGQSDSDNANLILRALYSDGKVHDAFTTIRAESDTGINFLERLNEISEIRQSVIGVGASGQTKIPGLDLSIELGASLDQVITERDFKQTSNVSVSQNNVPISQVTDFSSATEEITEYGILMRGGIKSDKWLIGLLGGYVDGKSKLNINAFDANLNRNITISDSDSFGDFLIGLHGGLKPFENVIVGGHGFYTETASDAANIQGGAYLVLDLPRYRNGNFAFAYNLKSREDIEQSGTIFYSDNKDKLSIIAKTLAEGQFIDIDRLSTRNLEDFQRDEVLRILSESGISYFKLDHSTANTVGIELGLSLYHIPPLKDNSLAEKSYLLLGVDIADPDDDASAGYKVLGIYKPDFLSGQGTLEAFVEEKPGENDRKIGVNLGIRF